MKLRKIVSLIALCLLFGNCFAACAQNGQDTDVSSNTEVTSAIEPSADESGDHTATELPEPTVAPAPTDAPAPTVIPL